MVGFAVASANVTTRKITALYDLRCPMRDGVDLVTDVHMPAEGGPFPTVITRTPYDRGDEDYLLPTAIDLAQRGFAVATQDTRGRYDSGGDWYPVINEARDGAGRTQMGRVPALVERKDRDVRRVLRGTHPVAGGPGAAIRTSWRSSRASPPRTPTAAGSTPAVPSSWHSTSAGRSSWRPEPAEGSTCSCRRRSTYPRCSGTFR